MAMCRNCAKQSPEDASYCMHCGSRMVAYSPAEAQAYLESLRPPAPVKLPPMPKRDLGTFDSKIVGVSHDNDDGTSRQGILRRCRAGEHLTLKHTPVQQDKNGVSVFRLNGEQVGWLSRELAASVAPYLDAGARLDVTITTVTGGEGGDFLGCNVAVAYIPQ